MKNSLAMTAVLLLSAAQVFAAAHAENSPAASATAKPAATQKVAPSKSAAASQRPAQAGRPALKARPVGDAAIKRTVADAMGFIRFMGPAETNKVLNRIQWSGAGKMIEGGTTYNVIKYTYTVSLHLKAAREDIQRKTPGKAERLVAVVVDQDAWDEKEPGVEGRKTTESALNRRLKLARTPLGFTRVMLDADQATVKVVDPGTGGKVTISLPIEGVLTTAELNSDYRPETIAMQVDGKTIVATDRGYKDISEYGVMFPTHMTETVDGHPYLDLTIDDARVASYAAFPKPDFLKAH